MMRVVFKEKARGDLRNVLGWFREKNDGSETRFEVAFEAELDVLLVRPGGYRVRRSPFRFAMVGRFRYFIIYVIEDDVIVIHRVRHMHQRPLKRYHE